MGCCGCTLATTAVTAVVFGLIESIYGLAWNILVIVIMSQRVTNTTEENEELLSSTSNLSDVDYEAGEFYASIKFCNMTSEELWKYLSDNLQSDEAVKEHMLYVVVAALVLNAFWLITTLALAVGNAEKCKDMLKPWVVSTIVITITDIAATVYFIFKAVKTGDEFDIRTSFFTNLFVFYAFMFSRGAIIIWIINIALCVFVAQRAQEIEIGKSKRGPFNTDFNIMPYSLNPPYDTFETESSTRTSKNYRPHTPPPDYEGPNGKKRRPSLSSEPETMTLPLSMPSSRASLAHRPLSQSSYLYDDRVELQHRASCAAETVLHHAYENKGLVMEGEGWMGIPRPTLKSSH
ncbi:uncharacterized protein CDAR_258131 [Caerostris darwini]|uniref:Uncharacterized protein n=1 Tax=Caerostris darwini TaxID=1538125 RepID=A0AAV4WYJ8_9ARAC|nr:uncharacterized protein CDAR_258131 [Caerostris darwini]